jgi:hypothetical protein
LGRLSPNLAKPQNVSKQLNQKSAEEIKTEKEQFESVTK